MIKISHTLAKFFLVTTVSATILCGSVHALDWQAANVDTVNIDPVHIDPTHNALAAPPDYQHAPRRAQPR